MDRFEPSERLNSRQIRSYFHNLKKKNDKPDKEVNNDDDEYDEDGEIFDAEEEIKEKETSKTVRYLRSKVILDLNEMDS
jgi:hypothetical protein